MEIRFNWFDDRRARLQKAFEEIYPSFQEEPLIEGDNLTGLDREIAESAGTLAFKEIDFSSGLGIDNAFLNRNSEKEEFFTLYAQMNCPEGLDKNLNTPVLDTATLNPQIIDEIFEKDSNKVISAIDIDIAVNALLKGPSETIINPYENISPDLYFQGNTLETSSEPIKEKLPDDFWRWN